MTVLFTFASPAAHYILQLSAFRHLFTRVVSIDPASAEGKHELKRLMHNHPY